MDAINIKNRVELEFTFNTSPSILFNRLSTPSGLAEWFADDVRLDGDTYTFIWDGSESQAELVRSQDNKCVKFKWIENDDETFFEFRICPDQLTGGLALHVIEQLSDDDDTEDAESLWNYQICELKRHLGV